MGSAWREKQVLWLKTPRPGWRENIIIPLYLDGNLTAEDASFHRSALQETTRSTWELHLLVPRWRWQTRRWAEKVSLPWSQDLSSATLCFQHCQEWTEEPVKIPDHFANIKSWLLSIDSIKITLERRFFNNHNHPAVDYSWKKCRWLNLAGLYF